jgi:hypothetical protein
MRTCQNKVPFAIIDDAVTAVSQGDGTRSATAKYRAKSAQAPTASAIEIAAMKK